MAEEDWKWKVIEKKTEVWKGKSMTDLKKTEMSSSPFLVKNNVDNEHRNLFLTYSLHVFN